MTRQEQINNSHTAILKELSDIGKNLAVNTNETSNIKINMEKRLGEIQNDVKEAKIAIQTANGRTTKLEEWSNEAKKIIEATSKLAAGTATDYGKDQRSIWTAIKIISIVIPVLLTLVSTVLYFKAKEIAVDVVGQALKENVTKIEQE